MSLGPPSALHNTLACHNSTIFTLSQ